ncbi:Glutamate decarboxylase 1 [Smittium mucronatum]|uniref:Glutamate decarboxylase 1 n=1 Tax=Smittium mucronatum TaxID=133383 RepID=A0A1R0H0G4_9FUNG|nr:Glutamate decarboxylase 1 [Smittium mucronatum]
MKLSDPLDSEPQDAQIFDDLISNLRQTFFNYIKSGQESTDLTLDYLSPSQISDLVSLNPTDAGSGQNGIIFLISQLLYRPPKLLVEISFCNNFYLLIGIVQDVINILKYSPNTWNPGFMHKLYSSTSAIGVIGELVTAIMNSNGHIYLASPFASTVEILLSKKLGVLFGYDESKCGGLTCPGGSYSNNLALLVARNYYFPYAPLYGFALTDSEKILFDFKQPVIFTSNQSHYSIEKSVMMLGLGKRNIVFVKSGVSGVMDSADLEFKVSAAISEGKKPFFVNATAGTTVLGQFDPIKPISEICQKYDMWLHVDASLGGSLVFSKSQNYKEKLDGSGSANSITFNPHKLLGVPLQCSYLLVRDGLSGVRKQVSTNANYLYHKDDEIPSPQCTAESNSNKNYFGNNAECWDIGDATIGCGRKPDSLKMWLSWRYFGYDGFATRVDNSLKSASTFSKLINSLPDFYLFRTPTSNIVCFYYVPPSQKNHCFSGSQSLNGTSSRIDSLPIVHDESRLDFPEIWGTFTKSICKDINSRGKVLIDFASINLSKSSGELVRIPEFFRIPFNSPFFSISHLHVIIDQISSSALSLYP